ncbi:nuclease-related domain-containing protein [Flavobacterium sp.]|jgi:hypothetical protein|uniref:nuclease-related domain-containing protein n=1 Tax=Flavobacterium sp. TaxID=239 RepID=UPI0037BE548A
MSSIHNTIGSLKTIQIELVNNNIDDFQSIDELIAFKKEYHIIKQNIIENHNLLIQNEKEKLEKEINNFHFILESKITGVESNYNLKRISLFQEIEELPLAKNKIIPSIIDYWSNFIIWSKIILIYFEHKFKYFKIVIRTLIETTYSKKRLKYLENNFTTAVAKSYAVELEEVSKKNKVITHLNNFIYGAIGEQKVVNVLKDLKVEYFVINDFNYTFNTPLNNKYENSIIKTIQIDHIVITTAGIFIIETKNWSTQSLNNKDLKSPVTQINNLKYALSILLSKSIQLKWSVNNHHWGNQKTPIRNIIVLINQKTEEKFNYVKICSLHELNGYIEWFNTENQKVIYTKSQINIITDYLLKTNNLTPVNSKLSM